MAFEGLVSHGSGNHSAAAGWGGRTGRGRTLDRWELRTEKEEKYKNGRWIE